MGLKKAKKSHAEPEKSKAVFDGEHGFVDAVSGIPEAEQKALNQRLLRAHKTGLLDLSHPKTQNTIGFNYTEIPFQVFDRFTASKLQQLWLTNHRLSVLPSELSLLKQLKVLGLGGNRLHKLSTSIGDLVRLEKLYLERNNLHSLPDQIANLESLSELMLDDNDFKHFPISIVKFKRLRRLGLSNNRISKIPHQIKSLSNLIELNLDSNELDAGCQDALQSLPNLRIVGLESNSIASQPDFLNALQLDIARVTGNNASDAHLVRRLDGYLSLSSIEHHMECSHQMNAKAAMFYRDASSDARLVLKARAKKRKWKRSNRLI